MTGQHVSHYRIDERLGRGGMGIVFAAEDLRLGRRVAIKFLPEEACCEPEAVQRFLREARAISSLNHPHICTLHDIGEHNGQQYMVMELLEGEPLKSRVARGPLPLDEVLLFGEHIADALDAAHGKGIVHRDLKPANLFVTHRGHVKVLDFGVAKLAEPKGGPASVETVAGSDQLTTYGSALGTIHYMSPEQARGLEIDGRSDIFSLGIVLYEMATGRAPFQGTTAGAIFEQIFGGVPAAPSQLVGGIPTDFDRIVFRALEKDRELRYQSAADLRAELRRLRKASESARVLAMTGYTPSAAPAAGPSRVASASPAADVTAQPAADGPSAAGHFPVASASTVDGLPPASAPSAAAAPGGSSVSSAAAVPAGSSASSAAAIPAGASESSAAALPAGSSVSSAAAVPAGSSAPSAAFQAGASVSSAAPIPAGASQSSAAALPAGSSVSSAAAFPAGSSVSSAAPIPAGASVSSAAALGAGSSVPSADASSSMASRSGLMWWAAALASVAVVGGVLWWRSAQTPALANRDTVVVADFVNRTGDTMFDDTLNEALGVQLRQSPFLNVLNEQQQQATLRLMGRDPMAAVTPDVGRELCQRAGGKALLGGTIASLGAAYLVTLSAQDCVTAEVLAEEQVQATGKEQVLVALNGAVRSFRERLGESLASIQRYDAPVEQATTSSLDALKAYSQGMARRRTEGDFEALPFFKRAVELDPNFALAYARLGTVHANLGQAEEARRASTKAFELRDRTSDRERLYVEARYHTTVEEDFDRAIEAYRLLLATYPDDFAALSNTGGLLRQQGRIEEAIPMLQAATRAAPDQANPHLNLGSAYLDVNRTDEARAEFEQALTLQDSTIARSGLFLVATLTGDQALADAQVAAVKGRRDEVNLLGQRVQAALLKGRAREAATLAEEWTRRMEQEGAVARIGEPMMGMVTAEALFGLTAQAATRFADLDRRGYLTPGTADDQLTYAMVIGDRRLAERSHAVAVKERQGNRTFDEDKRVFDAMLAMAQGRPDDVARLIEPPVADPKRFSRATLWTVAQVQAGRTAESLRGIDLLLAQPARLGLGPMVPWLMAQRVRMLIEAGREADAETARQRFLEFWKDADKDVPLLRATDNTQIRRR